MMVQDFNVFIMGKLNKRKAGPMSFLVSQF